MAITIEGRAVTGNVETLLEEVRQHPRTYGLTHHPVGASSFTRNEIFQILNADGNPILNFDDMRQRVGIQGIIGYQEFRDLVFELNQRFPRSFSIATPLLDPNTIFTMAMSPVGSRAYNQMSLSGSVYAGQPRPNVEPNLDSLEGCIVLFSAHFPLVPRSEVEELCRMIFGLNAPMPSPAARPMPPSVQVIVTPPGGAHQQIYDGSSHRAFSIDFNEPRDAVNHVREIIGQFLRENPGWTAERVFEFNRTLNFHIGEVVRSLYVDHRFPRGDASFSGSMIIYLPPAAVAHSTPPASSTSPSWEVVRLEWNLWQRACLDGRPNLSPADLERLSQTPEGRQLSQAYSTSLSLYSDDFYANFRGSFYVHFEPLLREIMEEIGFSIGMSSSRTTENWSELEFGRIELHRSTPLDPVAFRSLIVRRFREHGISISPLSIIVEDRGPQDNRRMYLLRFRSPSCEPSI